mmetsp:Transcript_14700/g.49439  ORF Transcript_14700/g.49439 Transcript_14700/m.49439 type:complete len:375 (-) Transcript_14700:327-1451(-)
MAPVQPVGRTAGRRERCEDGRPKDGAFFGRRGWVAAAASHACCERKGRHEKRECAGGGLPPCRELLSSIGTRSTVGSATCKSALTILDGGGEADAGGGVETPLHMGLPSSVEPARGRSGLHLDRPCKADGLGAEAGWRAGAQLTLSTAHAITVRGRRAPASLSVVGPYEWRCTATASTSSCAAIWAEGARRRRARAEELWISSSTLAEQRSSSTSPGGRGTVAQEGRGSCARKPLPSEPMHLAVSCPPGQTRRGPQGRPLSSAACATRQPDASTRARSVAESCTRWHFERRIGSALAADAISATHEPELQVVTSARRWLRAQRTSVHAAATDARRGWLACASACARWKTSLPARRKEAPVASPAAYSTMSDARC